MQAEAMTKPSQPVTLSAEQIEALAQGLSEMRHEVNNHLSLVAAAAEIMQKKPEAAPKMIATISAQPTKVTQAIKKFASDFDTTFGRKPPRAT